MTWTDVLLRLALAARTVRPPGAHACGAWQSSPAATEAVVRYAVHPGWPAGLDAATRQELFLRLLCAMDWVHEFRETKEPPAAEEWREFFAWSADGLWLAEGRAWMQRRTRPDLPLPSMDLPPPERN